MPILFSYGTLQQESVQLSTFGRLLDGQRDELPNYERSQVKIEDAQAAAEMGSTHYANVRFTGLPGDRVSGMAFEVTEAELAAADAYEEDAAYDRIRLVLASGKEAWVYVRTLSSAVRRSYDSAAEGYASHLANELEQKPLDRHLLNRFAEATRGQGLVADLGCGPGHVAAYLHEQGAEMMGIDLSPEMVRVAREMNPAIEFRTGDMTALDLERGSLAGIVAFYSIVHFEPGELQNVFREMHRVLQPDGCALIAFHVGEEVVHVDELFGAAVSLDFRFHEPEAVARALRDSGFRIIEQVEREPYEGAEFPSRRCYLLARRAGDLVTGTADELTAQGVVEVVVPDIRVALEFYRKIGFTIERETPTFVTLRWEAMLFFLAENPGATTAPRWSNVRVIVSDVDRIWNRMNELGVPIGSRIADRPYGLRDFTVKDPAGFEIRFAQVI